MTTLPFHLHTFKHHLFLLKKTPQYSKKLVVLVGMVNIDFQIQLRLKKDMFVNIVPSYNLVFVWSVKPFTSNIVILANLRIISDNLQPANIRILTQLSIDYKHSISLFLQIIFHSYHSKIRYDGTQAGAELG